MERYPIHSFGDRAHTTLHVPTLSCTMVYGSVRSDRDDRVVPENVPLDQGDRGLLAIQLVL